MARNQKRGEGNTIAKLLLNCFQKDIGIKRGITKKT